MQNRLTELAVGLFLLLGIGGLFILTARVSNLSSYGNDGTIAYSALFEDIGGLNTGSAVKISGVTIGRVSQIGFDNDARRARVDFTVRDEFQLLPVDTIASIYTSGLLGEQFVGLQLGNSATTLPAGGTLIKTDSAVVLEKTIAKIENSVGEFLGATTVPEGFAQQSYTVTAKFDEIGGLKVGAPVKMSGVAMGYVTDIQYDDQFLQAIVTASIDNQYDFIPEDTGASILSSSLIGGQYLSLEPGGSMKALKNGSKLAYSQSAIILEKMLSRVLFSLAASEKSDDTQ